MTSTDTRQSFGSPRRVSQSLRNDRCQNILYKSVFEQFEELKWIAALLLASKSFQNSSFGIDLILNFVVDDNIILLFKNVLSPSSCLPLQFISSLHIKNSKENSCETVDQDVSNFVAELADAKHLPLRLQSLTLELLPKQIVGAFVKAPNTWPQLQSLSLVGCRLDETVMERISKSATHLTSLNVRASLGITDVGLEHFAKSINLSSLDVSDGCDINDTALQQISSFNGITNLNLRGCRKISDAGLHHVAKLANSIVSLDLLYCDRITDVGLQHVSRLSRITFLDLSWCNRITNAGVRNLSRLSCLTELSLSGIMSFDDSGMEHMAKLFNATSLDFSTCNRITDAGLEHISKLSNVAILNLSRCDLITDAGLQHLSKLSKMTSLNLSWVSRITDVGIEQVSKLSNLVFLNCDSCSNITDVGLAHILTKCLSVETLKLHHCITISDRSCELISKLPRLSHLDLCDCENISDAGMRAISKVSSITYLRICFCEKVTDLGLRLAAKLPNLRYLSIIGCELMTETCKEKFVKVFPNCELVES